MVTKWNDLKWRKMIWSLEREQKPCRRRRSEPQRTRSERKMTKTSGGDGRKHELEDDKPNPTRDADLVKACEPHRTKTQRCGSGALKNQNRWTRTMPLQIRRDEREMNRGDDDEDHHKRKEKGVWWVRKYNEKVEGKWVLRTQGAAEEKASRWVSWL